MPGRLPPLYPLRAFEATARTGSVTAAAQELNVTHSAVSHQLRTLESHLQVQLFARSGRRLKLTSQGAALLPDLTAAFERMAWATSRLDRPVMSGELRIGCVAAVLTYWLLPRLDAFAGRYPDIRLYLDTARTPEGLYRSAHDVAILYGDGTWKDLWVTRWSTVQLFPVANPTLLHTTPIRSVRDLAEHRLLFAGDHREWQSWLVEAGAPQLTTGRSATLSDAYLTTQAALLGQGVALGDSITSQPLLENGSLVAPFTRKVAAPEQMYLACRNESRDNPLVRAFMDWAMEAIGGAVFQAVFSDRKS